jgi:hypothetical protein
MRYRGDLLIFDPVDFLKEAVDDFLESGTEPSKIASAVIKVATGVELLLKEKLERICPTLILSKIDVLQVVKVFKLEKHLRNPKHLELVELKTADFDTLLQRASHFIDLSKDEPSLRRLQKIRNSLVHHQGNVDLHSTNLLLVKEVFPFIESFGKTDPRLQLKLSTSVWDKIKKIEKASTNALNTQLAKKMAHHERQAEKLTQRELRIRLESEPESYFEDMINHSLICPACKNHRLAAFGGFDEQGDEDGFSRAYYILMECRVCELKLDSNEAGHILDNFGEFFGNEQKGERTEWLQAFELPDEQ